MNKILSCLSILFSIVLFSCAGQGTDYFEDYYPSIYRAERLALDSSYHEALLIYRTAFSNVPFVFGKDYYNAATCAILSGAHSDAFDLFDKLALQGMSLQWLGKQAAVKPLLNTEGWKKFTKRYPALRKSFFKNYNREIKQQLVSLDSADQFFRKHENAYTVYIDTIHAIDRRNATALYDIIGRYGFPGEKLIGINDSISATFPGDLVLIHQASAGLPYTSPLNFDALANEARKGNIPAHAVAYFHDARSSMFFASYVSLGLCKAVLTDSTAMSCGNCPQRPPEEGHYVYIKRSGKELQTFDDTRRKMGLEPFNEFMRKVYAGENNSPLFFQYLGDVSTFHFYKKEDMLAFMAGFSPIDQ